MMPNSGNGRFVLQGLIQDATKQLGTGFLMRPDEYIVWIDYLRECADRMEQEHHNLTADLLHEELLQSCIDARTVSA